MVRLIFHIQSDFLFINLANAAPNSLIFAEYTLASIGSTPSQSNSIFSPVRLVAFLCLTGVLALHGLHVPAGIRLQNLLGFTKIGILLILVGTGFMAFTGNLQEGVPRAGNFDSWEQIWAGSTTGGSALCTCLYNVSLISSRALVPIYINFQILYCFVGFNNANYSLSEVHNPVRTLRIAGPLSIVVAALFYLLCNIAYYSAASKEEITSSGRLVAALLFKNVWGPRAERILNAFIALSALGNVVSVVCLFFFVVFTATMPD